MDLLGIQADLAKAQDTLNEALSRVAALETQSARDVNQITDKIIAAVLPEVQAARASIDQAVLVINASVTEITALVRRLDGAKLLFTLGPENPA